MNKKYEAFIGNKKTQIMGGKYNFLQLKIT